MSNLNAGADEGPGELPAKFEVGCVRADTAKDFIWELARACPAVRLYLERLVTADQIMDLAHRDAPEVADRRRGLIANWVELRRTT